LKISGFKVESGANDGFCRKDDYAFFLHPVDVANVPGYSDVVKHPMDLGTMTNKVARGKYRSLEEFTVCS
jgi:bromodomain-containing protein 7/9